MVTCNNILWLHECIDTSMAMAHNANRYTTFGAGNRAMRSIDPCPKCAGAKPHKGRSDFSPRPTAVLRNLNCPNRAVSSYRLLCAGYACPIFYYLYLKYLCDKIHIGIKYIHQNIKINVPIIFAPAKS